MVEPTSDQAPVVIDSMETLPLRMLDAFWCLRNNSMTITSPDRMREVLRLIAAEVEQLEPARAPILKHEQGAERQHAVCIGKLNLVAAHAKRGQRRAGARAEEVLRNET